MEVELKNFMKVWVSSTMSISYCYYLSTRIKTGVFRLLSVLPVCVLFFILPMFSSSVHLSGFTAFSLTWLATFKLILFSFDKGPLYPLPHNIYQFICFTCFPIKHQQNPSSQIQFPKWIFAIRVAIFGVLLHIYEYKQYLSSNVLLVLYSLHIYLEFEILLAPLKVLLSMILGCDLELQFNEPYLATSLQDFWGRRWNLMVPAILRPSIYYPVQKITERKMNNDQARFLGVFATFIVSGAVHELIFFYFTRERPTGEVTLFFLLHGVCTAAEGALKRTNSVRRWKMSLMTSRLLTVGFVVVTGGWLFFPPLIRSGMIERLCNEVFSSGDFVKHTFSCTFGGFATNL
ncbi:hypothetical protein Bca52824_035893 [Brassica carinata]|uniref:long-chain-alcohol O-fatty-acyltransferase n=1 Tax=Brassica carinata TaxID=52824 RepID=A0A8X7V4H3_BRACI|nr:hypothetical protein Bca52824_035893 [Brassica carinata]